MLHIIRGRAGSGKTAFVREKINSVLEEGLFRPVLLVPDQFSFENERSMLSFLGAKKMKQVDVFSFSRLALENLDSEILKGKMFADDGVRMAFMSEALSQLSGELKIFSKVRHNVSGLESFIQLNKELKTSAVTSEELINVAEAMPQNLLKDKLLEINLINEAYDSLLSRSYFDDTESLKYFNTFAENTNYFENKVVFFDSFKSFSAQEFKTIRLALLQAEDVYVTICSDGQKNEDSPFVFMNELEKRIKSIARKCDVNVATDVDLEPENDFSEAISFIEKNIYTSSTDTYDGTDDSVTIFECNDITDECSTVACEIKKLIRSGKYRCRDIAVVTRDDSKYKRLISDMLKRYGVPVFEDSRRPLSFETLFVYVTSAIECIAEGFKTETVMRYLKTGLTGLSFEEVSRLEKYILVWGISGNAWLNDFTMHPNGFGSSIDEKSKEQIAELNKLRKKVIIPLEKLKKSCDGASGLDISKNIYTFLVDTKVSNTLYELSSTLNDEGFSVEATQKERSWDVLIEVLETVAEITKDKYYSLKRWFEIFSILVFSKDIGEIPQGLDEVKIGNADRIRTDNVKVMFLLGVNKNEFPLIKVTGGLLTDSDRRILSDMNLEIRPPFEKLIFEEKFIVYCMLGAAKEKLYLSFRQVSDDETTSGPSELIDEIKALLPNVKEINSNSIDPIEKIESEFSAFFTLAKIFNENTELKHTLLEYFKFKPEYSGRLKSISLAQNGTKGEFENPEISKKLFGENIYLSASKLDNFYLCPFSFFCKYGLNINKIKAAELQPTDSGIIMHGVLEEVLRKYQNGEFLKISEEELRAFVSEYLKNYLEEKMGGALDKSKRFMFIYNRMVDVLMLIFERLKNELSAISFKPVDFELKIGGKEIPAYKLPLENGGEISITGSIDRVDMMEKDGIKYLRVIDYKTGKKTFKLANLLSGINLQMVLYLMALTENGKDYYGDAIPSGVLYLPSRIGISNYLTSRNPSIDEINAQKRQSGKLSGMVLNSPVVMNGMGIESFPDYLPVSYKKDNLPSGNYYSQKHFKALSEKVNEKIIEMGNSLHNGKFSILPASESGKPKPCGYCEYRSVCGFEDGDNTSEICNLAHGKVLEMLGGDDDGEGMD